VSRKYRNWYQNEVDEEIKGVDSRNKVKHNKRSDRLLLERIIVPMLSRGVVRVILRLAVLTQYRRGTDRHTATANSRASIKSRG